MLLPLDGPVVCPVLIGRKTYLSTLDRLIAASVAGQGQTVSFCGEAGIGKSRLVSFLKSRAEESGFQTLIGHSYEYRQSLPFGPLLEVIASLAAEREELTETLQSNPSPSWTANRLLENLTTANNEQKSAKTQEQQKYLLFTNLLKLLKQQAASRPTLLIIEDLHWCDETTLEFLLFLVYQILQHPVFLLLTYRNDEANASLEHFLAEMDRTRQLTEIILYPFSPVEAGFMIQTIFDMHQPVSNEFLNPIYDLTGGNPFFLEEVLRSMIAGKEILLTDGNWKLKPVLEWHIPRSILDAVQRRMNKLSLPARALLALASAAGPRFEFPLLVDLAGEPEPVVLNQIKELISAQLLVDEGSGFFGFRHNLTQQAIYSRLIEPERKALHVRIGEALERFYGDKSDAHAAQLSHHFYQAGNWQKTYKYSVLVGEKGLALNATTSVIENFSRAVEAVNHLNIEIPVWLLLGRSAAYETKGEFKPAEADLQCALQIARKNENLYTEWKVLIAYGFLWAGQEFTRAGTFFREALSLSRTLGDAVLEGHSLNRIGNWQINTGQIEQGLAAHHEALALFEKISDPTGLCEANELLGLAYSFSGDYTRVIFHYEQAMRYLREMENYRTLASVLNNYTLIKCGLLSILEVESVQTFSLQDAKEQLEEAFRLARQLEWLPGQAHFLFSKSGVQVQFGELGGSLQSAQEALRIATQVGHRQWMMVSCLVLGMVHSSLFENTLAISYLHKALAWSLEFGVTYWKANITFILSRLYMNGGNLKQAEELLSQFQPADYRPKNYMESLVALGWSKLHLLQGHPDKAFETVQYAVAGIPIEGPKQPSPWVLKIKAEASLALGKNGEALSYLLHAKEVAVKRQLQPFLLELHACLADFYIQSTKKAEAHQELEEARQLVEVLAYTIEDIEYRARYRESALQSLPKEKIFGVEQPNKKSFDGLTAREYEVAGLVAGGHTNREIAEKLVLSERTVEAHIGRILNKLNFASRSQIAVWVVEKNYIRP